VAFNADDILSGIAMYESVLSAADELAGDPPIFSSSTEPGPGSPPRGDDDADEVLGGTVTPPFASLPPLPPPADVRVDLEPGGDFERVIQADQVELVFDSKAKLFCLCHLVSRERLFLPVVEAEYVLDVQDDGEVLVVEVNDDEPKVFNAFDLLKIRLYTNREGRIMSHLLPTTVNGMAARVWLADLLAKHLDLKLFLKSMESAAEDVLEIALFSSWRLGGKSALMLDSVLDVLSVKRKDKTTAGYICHQEISWNKHLREFGFPLILRSIPYDGKHAMLHEHELHARVLRSKAISCGGMVLLLSRWAFGSKSQGGFDRDSEKIAARNLLERLIRLLYGTSGFTMLIFADRNACQSKAGLLVGQFPCSIIVDRTGFVDCKALMDIVVGNRDAALCMNHIKKRFGSANGILLMDLLQWLSTVGFARVKEQTFTMQVFTRLGEGLDELFQDFPDDSAYVSARARLTREALVPRVSVNNARYYQAVHDTVAATDQIHFSGAMDKSRVHTIGLLDGVFAIPENKAWYAPPQDPPWFPCPRGWLAPGKSIVGARSTEFP
jgi:hypothetical protein